MSQVIDPEDKTREMYDRLAQSWSSAHAKENYWKDEVTRLKEMLPSGTVIEIGCGGGRDAQELIRLGYKYVGTDVSSGMIEVAKKEAPGADFRQCSVYDLPKLGKKFDGFWACAVLLHIPKARIDEALKAISDTLNSGAIGMISMKDGDREEFEIRDKNGEHQERLFVYWRKDDFLEVLTKHGFKLLEYTYRPESERTNWHIFFIQKTK